jgi:hypothetical protein
VTQPHLILRDVRLKIENYSEDAIFVLQNLTWLVYRSKEATENHKNQLFSLLQEKKIYFPLEKSREALD